MNNPEVTMRGPQPTSNFIAHSKAVEAAGIAITAVLKVPAPLKSLADQVIRSASSVPANLAEGAGRAGRDRTHHYRIAYGSAKEVDSHLRLLIATGAVNGRSAEPVLALFDEVRAMTWRLLNPSR
jgi:four helix bundle protein